MGMNLRRSLLLALVSAPLVVVLACNGQNLDVGETRNPDSGNPQADVRHDEIPLGLAIDGTVCSEVDVSGSADQWPQYGFVFHGSCPSVGPVAGGIHSRSDIAYPQPCSVATSLGFGLPFLGSDAGYLDFIADATHGSCTVTSGPTTADPAGALAFEGTIVSANDPAQTHRVTYRATGPVPNASDAGDSGLDPDGEAGVDANIGDGDGDGRPSGPSRTTATACSGTRPAGVRDNGATGDCAADADCTSGTEGRCSTRTVSGARKNVCTYQRCGSDAMCTGTAVCGCGVGAISQQNLCLSNSNCRVDSDCASGETCQYSNPIVLRASTEPLVLEGNETGGTNYNGQAIGYFCTSSSKDTCFESTRPDGGIASGCAFNIERGHWEWVLGP